MFSFIIPSQLGSRMDIAFIFFINYLSKVLIFSFIWSMLIPPTFLETIFPSTSMKYEVGIDAILYFDATLWSGSIRTLKLYLLLSIKGLTVLKGSPISTATITKLLFFVSWLF